MNVVHQNRFPKVQKFSLNFSFYRFRNRGWRSDVIRHGLNRDSVNWRRKGGIAVSVFFRESPDAF